MSDDEKTTPETAAPLVPLRKPALSTDMMVVLGLVGLLFLAFIVGSIAW